MTYPDQPNNKLIVNGIDIGMHFRMVLMDGYELSPPQPKTYTVDIPGGDGVIDLTEALTGDVVYENRSQKFTFAVIRMKKVDDVALSEFEKVKTEVSNMLHGKAFDYQITMDPGYTYHGRFTVDSYTQQLYGNGRLGLIEISVDADPYKLKENCVYQLNAIGGKMFRLESGRKPVHPVIECSQPCDVTWNGETIIVPAGTFRLNDILFTDGWNEIYINSYHFWNITWGEIDQGGEHQLTWAECSQYRWDDIQRLEGNLEDVAYDTPRAWSDLFNYRWSDLTDDTWRGLNLSVATEAVDDVFVTLQYEWKDL